MGVYMSITAFAYKTASGAFLRYFYFDLPINQICLTDFT